MPPIGPVLPDQSPQTENATTQMNTFLSVVSMLAESNPKDDIKLKAAQELFENFEVILQSPQYPQFLDHSIKIFLKILAEGEPLFISEYNLQQVRKLILEMIHRFPTNDALRPYAKNILTLVLRLLAIENEENTLVCLRIIIEMHKTYRPTFNTETQNFLKFVKSIYSELPNHLNRIFEPRPPLKVNDLAEINIEQLLQDTYTITAIQSEKKAPDGTAICYNLIPKGVLSLKVLQELPIIVVLFYQIYRTNVMPDICDYIQLIMSTIILQPTPQQRQSVQFNKEVFVDFMGAQIKTLSFLAYIVRFHLEVVAQYSQQMVLGILNLLELCPQEVCHLRKELLIAIRHIFATDMKHKFVPHMEKLFDESILLGNGWTVRDTLRPLAYSTLADLVHHVRPSLPLADLARAVHLFGKIVHDPSLQTTIQTMSCKLLLNLVDCIKKAEAENGTQCRELLMRMLEIFVLKFKTFAKLTLPVLINKSKSQLPTFQTQVTTLNQTQITEIKEIKPEDMKEMSEQAAANQAQLQASLQNRGLTNEDKSKFGFPVQQMSYNVADYRNLVKTLVCGVKTITWGCKSSSGEGMLSKQFTPKETLVFIRLVKWAMRALDIYQVTIVPVGLGGQPLNANQQQLIAARQAGMAGRTIQGGATMQNVRTQEEKEVLEHFSGVFSMMSDSVFRDVFSTTIAYMVERIHHNVALQTVANSFLANAYTSPVFATVLVEYLLERMSEMGSSVERSNLYLRLFKLVFGSVSLFPAENEHMLRPHLHQIVNRSMELAMSAKEPFNYFLLLRALFRSIGGGSHDLLYQEFLPLLPNLLEGLNRLQSGLHKQHMKDLFVELCLTVPVRLSSLLPYLPMLMDPLVSALNGSHTLISQGLRTLELCVDNLQPDFLYEHIQPVRADLMQALWRTLRNPDQVAHVAFRVLGKFGGGNRKMMIEPQRLEYNDRDMPGPAIVAEFQDHEKPIDFPVEKVIDTAVNALKSSTTDSFYHKQCWEVIKCYLAASLNLDDNRSQMIKLFLHPSFKEGPIPQLNGPMYKSQDKQARDTHQTALTGMFVAAAIKDLRHSVLPIMVSLVRHYTMVAIAQQAGPFPLTNRPADLQRGLDPLVLIDSLAVIMGHEEKELCKPGHLALNLILETATLILGSKERACQLPLMEYLQERMCSLCYDRAWYSKLGGCFTIKFLFENMSLKWVHDHLFIFLKALMFVMMDLTGEVSSGALDMAKSNLEKMLIICVAPVDENNEELKNAREKALFDVTNELVRLVTSPHTLVREQAMCSLRLLAEKQGMGVARVMQAHKKVLESMVPPTRHQLKHQPANAQIGLMDGNTFCVTLTPCLFEFDLSIKAHKAFFDELLHLCEQDDNVLTKLSCYKSVTNLVPIRKSALRCLAAYYFLQTQKGEKIFSVLYKALDWNNAELQQTAFECMKKFLTGYQIEMEVVRLTMRPLLLSLGDHRLLTLNVIKRLSYLTQLFPSIFHEKICEQLLQHLNKFLESLVQAHKGVSKNGENEQKIATIISIFHQIPAASPKFIVILCRLVLQTEKQLYVEASSPFREPLMKFLLRYPTETLEIFLQDSNLKEQQWNRYLHYLIKHDDGKPFRDHLQNHCVPRLINLILIFSQVNTLTITEKYELRHQAIRITSLLIRYDDQWLATQTQLVDALKQIWVDDSYQELHNKVETIIEITHWKEPKLVVKILLQYFTHHPNDIDLLFQLLRAFCHRFIPDFQFLRDFLENIVAQNYTVDWKRQAFFRFVEHFKLNTMSQVLKSKILQLILIPCFSVSIERGETTRLVGTSPSPYQDSDDNVISVFINKLIDQSIELEDCVRIALLQFSCLLVEQASPYIHDASNKRQGNKLRRLMTFAWPCLLGKNCVDATTRYHGHLLLAHIIAKFAIHKRIVLQVFHSLVKAHAQEARMVVKQALEILTPAMPYRMEEGNTMLIHWTKKIIVEEGHSVQQLYHILQLVVRHYKVYYPVRHHLIQYIVSSINRLGFSQTSTLEHRKLAVELAEVVVKWDLQRIKEESETTELPGTETVMSSGGVKRTNPDDMSGLTSDRKRMMTSSGSVVSNPIALAQQAVPGSSAGVPAGPKSDADINKPIRSADINSVLNFLLKLACHVNEPSNSAVPVQQGSPGELLSRRCVTLLKTALKPDVWAQQCDLKLGWFDKVFQSVENSEPNYGNITTALELLTFLLNVLKNDQILTNFKLLQKGLGACICSKDTKVLHLVYGLLEKLMSIFPAEDTSSNIACKYDELDLLYSTVAKMIRENLANYANTEKSPSLTTGSLFGPLMILKACCKHNPSYIDRLITPFMSVLLRMTKDHLSATASSEPGTDKLVASELLILSLDLVKTRVVVMSVDMRKQFIGTILVGLIEKTQDIKVMKAITKMVEEWIKSRNPITLSQAPSIREKSILLVKMMQYVEKRFPDDAELNAQFLELVNYVYRDEQLKTTELSVKLEPAFMSGLRCTVQPAIRAKFFSVLDGSMRRRLHDRLMYIVCSQSWDAIGAHYWLKQCIELLIVTAVQSKEIQMSSETSLVPSVGSVINLADNEDKKNFIFYSSCKPEPEESNDGLLQEDVLDMVLGSVESNSLNTAAATASPGQPTTPQQQKPKPLTITQLVNQQRDYLDDARKIQTGQFLKAAAQLCHMDTTLAERVWLDVFPRLWSILSAHQHATLLPEIVSFVCSGTHVIQKDCHPSAIMTFVEALSHCTPSVPIKPPLMKYLGKSHNLWHRMTLNLEQMAFDQNVPYGQKQKKDIADCYDFEPEQSTSPQTDIMDSLSDMYALLCEEDMWAGLWQRHAKFRETNVAIAYEQQGFFEQAQGAYEVAMTRYKQDCNTASQRECLLWEQHWIRCAKELNQWNLLLEYGLKKTEKNHFLILDSAWRIPSWPSMKEALVQVEYSCPKEMTWKVNLYRGFVAICHSEEKHSSVIERCVELASGLCMREWRRLPKIVGHAHLPLLQAAQQIMELQEVAQIHQGLLHPSAARSSLHDMKAIVKTWRNRLPVIADDLSHWSDIFVWRQHHYQFIASHYEQGSQDHITSNHAMLGVHASAQAIIHFGKIARKHNLPGVCLESLTRIYTIPSVPIVDCFQKIRQQVKCHLQMAAVAAKNDPQDGGKQELQEGLDVVEQTNLKFFTSEMTAEFYALKGMLLAQIGRSDDANKAFSAAVQLHDVLVKAWALWGDYLEAIFTRDPKNISTGVSAITCFLHACRHQNESKSRKYLAKVLWLLTYDDKDGSLMEALDKYCMGVPAVQWLPWTPQLVGCLVQYDSEVILNLLAQVGRQFPQAVYFPMRTLYLTFKIEQRVGHKSSAEKLAAATAATQQASRTGSDTDSNQGQPSTHTETQGIKASPPVMRCTKILHILREIHPIVLLSLEGFVDQMIWFRETWYEEVLRQLRQCLAKCYSVAFENKADVNESLITPHMHNFVKKLVSTFGIGIENIASSSREIFSSAMSESLARRKKATEEDPVFQRMKEQFTNDFDFNHPEAVKLHNLIYKLKKWVKILEGKTKLLPKSFLIEEKCRFISNFSLKTAEVELPGEFLLPKHSHYFVRIARFMPRVDVVHKHNTAARRLYIRGHNGKIYPYLVVIDSGLGDARREERVLQLLRMLNHYLGKQKETSRRFLHFTVPRVVAVSPQMRLVEDNPASVSLLDIYKKGCDNLNNERLKTIPLILQKHETQHSQWPRKPDEFHRVNQLLADMNFSDMDHSTPIAFYYDRLGSVQARGSQASHSMLRDVLKTVQNTMIPKTMLKDWALHTFPSATDYWTFRKMFTLQLSLACLAEYVLYLTRLNPDMMYLHQDSGLINIAYFKFDVDDATQDLDPNKLNKKIPKITRPVPFRLTPNIIEFVSSIGVSGPLTASMIATARCLVQPNFKVPTILRAILKDEMIAGHKKKLEESAASQDSLEKPQEMDNELLILMVTKAVSMIMNRLNSLANFDVTDSKVGTLVAAASSHDNLCRMDPAWHPWL